jgi:hypothetical protein
LEELAMSEHKQTADTAARDGLTGRLLVTLQTIAELCSVSLRTARRWDAARLLPGRIQIRGAVRYQTDAVRKWIAAGCPLPPAVKRKPALRLCGGLQGAEARKRG